MNQRDSGNDTLSLTIEDKAVLHSAYMSCLRHGGLFLSTSKPCRMGDEVNILLRLMDDPESISIIGTVVWVTPKGAQGNRIAGIGVQFGEEDTAVRSRIENHLAGFLDSAHPTHTM